MVNEIWAELASLKFWVLVVFTNFAINLLSPHIKSVFDKFFRKCSYIFNKRKVENNQRENLLLSELVASEELRQIHRAEALFSRVRSVWFASLGIGMFVLASSATIVEVNTNKPLIIGAFILGTTAFSLSVRCINISAKQFYNANKAYKLSRKC
ncbi:hypothetical protein ABKZ05_003961 [Vibrio navarrensis]